MRARLRSLERKLVWERFQLIVQEVVDDFLSQWREDDGFAEDWLVSLEFNRRLISEGFKSPLASAAINYIDECRGKGMTPDRTELIQKLLPWYRP